MKTMMKTTTKKTTWCLARNDALRGERLSSARSFCYVVCCFVPFRCPSFFPLLPFLAVCVKTVVSSPPLLPVHAHTHVQTHAKRVRRSAGAPPNPAAPGLRERLNRADDKFFCSYFFFLNCSSLRDVKTRKGNGTSRTYLRVRRCVLISLSKQAALPFSEQKTKFSLHVCETMKSPVAVLDYGFEQQYRLGDRLQAGMPRGLS